MTHREVQEHYGITVEMINYCTKAKVCNFHLNYALNENYERFGKAVKAITAVVNEELKAIEKEAYDLGKAGSKITDDQIIFAIGFKLLTDEKKARHAELMPDFEKAMDEENEVKIYYVNPEKIQDIEMDFAHVQLLKRFYKPEEDENKK